MDSFLLKLRSGEVQVSDFEEYVRRWQTESNYNALGLSEYLGMSWEQFSRYVAAGRLIPKGVYCYDSRGVCPFWSINKDREHQENGYCAYMQKGDWERENGMGLLWDQCKECGLEPIDPEEELVTINAEATGIQLNNKKGETNE